MNAEQKKFILEKLIPFILREQGNGFMMDYWIENSPPSRHAPSCGTVACIGGSVGILVGNRSADILDIAEALGLSWEEVYGLCHFWRCRSSDTDDDYRWPEKFARSYSKANTPLRKARIAADLLREVVRTEGKCLDHRIAVAKEKVKA